MSSSKVDPLLPGMAELVVSSLENSPATAEPPAAESSKGGSSKTKWWRRGVSGAFVSVICFPFWLVWLVLRTAAFVVLFPFGGWRKKSKAEEGHGELEKKLQSLTSEEATVHKRMRRRNERWQALSRSLLGYSCIIEFVALVLAGMVLRSMEPPELRSDSDDPFTMSPAAFRHLATRWLIFLSPIVLIPGAALLLYSSIAQLTHSRDKKDRKLLEDLEAKRRTHLEELKKQTNFYATLQLIQKFEKPPVPELVPNAAQSGTQKGPKGVKRPSAGHPKGNTRGSPAAAAGRLLQLTDGPARAEAGAGSGTQGAPGSEAASSAGGDGAYGVPAVGGELRQRRSRRASIGGEWEMSPEKGVWTGPRDDAGAEVSEAGILIMRRRSADNEDAGPSGSRGPWGDGGASEMGGALGLGHGKGGVRAGIPGEAGAEEGGQDEWDEEEEGEQRQGQGSRWGAQEEDGKAGLLRRWGQGQGVFSRLAGLLVGEDPKQCYALICKRCHTHNGLARPEDFEFVSYICPRCHFFNPAPGPSAQQLQQQKEQKKEKDRQTLQKQEKHKTEQGTQQQTQVEEPEQRSDLSNGISSVKMAVQAEQTGRTTQGEVHGEVEEQLQGVGTNGVAATQDLADEGADLQGRSSVAPPSERTEDDETMLRECGLEGGERNKLQAQGEAGDRVAGTADAESVEATHYDDDDDMFEVVLREELEPESVSDASLSKPGHGTHGASKVRDSREAAEVLSSEAPSEAGQGKGLEEGVHVDPTAAGSKAGDAQGTITRIQTTAASVPHDAVSKVASAASETEASMPGVPDRMAGREAGSQGEGKEREAGTGEGMGTEEEVQTGDREGTERTGQSSSIQEGEHSNDKSSSELHGEQAGPRQDQEAKGGLDEAGDGDGDREGGAEAADGDGANSAPGTQSPSVLRSVIQKMSSRKGRSSAHSGSTGSLSPQDTPEEGHGSAALGKKGRRSSGRRSRRILA